MRYKGLYIIIIAGLIFIGFILFPNLSFYRHHVNYKQFDVYSDIEINEAIYKVLDKAETKIISSAIFDPELNYRIFISSGFKPYTIFCPSLKNAFAATYPIINNIFISKTEIENNLVFRNAKEDNERSLSSVIAHEVTHKLIENEIGMKGNRELATWKKEGYCEYISVDSKLDIKKGIKKIYLGDNLFSTSYDYLQYRIFVTYLLDIKGYTISSLIQTEFNYQQLEKEIIEYGNI